MIMGGKLLVCLVWIFWIMVIDNPVSGGPPNERIDDNINQLVEQLEKLKAIKLKTTGKLEEYNPTYGTTFDRVVKRGYVICGTNDEFPGFSEEAYDGDSLTWKGFDVDICKAVAAAVFGDSEAVEYEIINGVTRFTSLKDGTIDMLSAATTYTFTRNVLKRFEFLPTTYYDGQGFITKKTLGVSSAKQMHGAKICFKGSGTAAKNIADFMELHQIKYIPVAVSVNEKTKDVYLGVIVICMELIGLVLEVESDG